MSMEISVAVAAMQAAATVNALVVGTIAWMSGGGTSTGPGEGRYPEDYATRRTRNFSGKYASERDARSFARSKLGASPVEVGAGKLRSQDGRWQYRAGPKDLAGHSPTDTPHIHLERLDPMTGEVLENWHLRW